MFVHAKSVYLKPGDFCCDLGVMCALPWKKSVYISDHGVTGSALWEWFYKENFHLFWWLFSWLRIWSPCIGDFSPPKNPHNIKCSSYNYNWRNQYLTEKSLTIICGKSISFLVVLMKMKKLKKKRCMHYAYTSNALPLFFWVFTECWVLNCA